MYKIKFLLGSIVGLLMVPMYAKQEFIVNWYKLDQPTKFRYSAIMVQDKGLFLGLPAAIERKELVHNFLVQGDIPIAPHVEIQASLHTIFAHTVAQTVPYEQCIKVLLDSVVALQEQMIATGKRNKQIIEQHVKIIEEQVRGLMHTLSLDDQIEVLENRLTPELKNALEMYGQFVANYAEHVQEATARGGGIVTQKQVVDYVVKKTEHFTSWAVLTIADEVGTMMRSGKTITAPKIDEIAKVLHTAVRTNVMQIQNFMTEDDATAHQWIQRIADLQQLKQSNSEDYAAQEATAQNDLRIFASFIRQMPPSAYGVQQLDALDAAITAWDSAKMTTSLEQYRSALAQDMAVQKQWLDQLG